jgi:hypothetical protein
MKEKIEKAICSLWCRRIVPSAVSNKERNQAEHGGEVI